MLVHSLWQFALVMLLAMVLHRALRQHSATTRYHALLAAMFTMIIAPVATCFSPWPVVTSAPAVKFGPVDKSGSIFPSPNLSPRQHRDNTMTSVPESPVELAVKPQPEQERLSAVPIGLASLLSLVQERVQPWLPDIVLIWLAGVVVAAFRPLLSWHTVRRLRTVGVSPAAEAVQRVLERTAKRLRFARAVEVLQSTLVKTPVVVGYFRPAVLLPLCVVTGVPEAQLGLILAHELAHIRRHDYLINLLQTLVETLFFYHPAVWWLSHQIRNERENCCDDVAMTMADSRADYGRALLAIEELRTTSTALTLAANGGSLLTRIRRIAGCEPAPRITYGSSILCVVLISIAVFAALTWAPAPAAENSAQSPARTSTAAGAKDHPPLQLTAFGKVLGPKGKPVADATVYLREWSTYRLSSNPYNDSPQDVLATTHTDADGAFRFEKGAAKSFWSGAWLRKSPWDIVVVAKSYGLAWRHMRTARPSRAFEVKLQPATAISGRVTDRSGRPVVNAEVRIRGINPLGQELRYDYAAPGTLELNCSQLRPMAKTDDNGLFKLDGLPRDVLLTVMITHEHFDREFLHVATTNQPQPDLAITRRNGPEMAKIHPAKFTVELGPAPPRIVGRVVAADTNRPIAGARIGGASGSRWSYATADDHGDYVLKYLNGSMCRMMVEGPNGSPYLGRIVLVDLVKEKADIPVEIKLVRGQPLSGVVVAADTGRGVPGVHVAFNMGRDWNPPRNGALLPTYGKTDSTGRFQLVVPPGKGKVVILGPAPGFDLPRNTGRPEDLDPEFAKEIEVVHGQATPKVRFALRRAGSPIPDSGRAGSRVISGRVVDAAGKPVAGAKVGPSLWFSAPGEGWPVPTDRQGRFWLRLRRRLPEEFIIAIDRQRRLRGHARLPLISPSEPQKTPLEIRLAPTGTIKGRVVEGNQPVVNAQIQANEQVNDRYSAKTDEYGRFVIPFVEAGHRLYLSVHIDGYTETEGRNCIVEVAAGQIVEVAPVSMMRTDKLVAGTVVDPDGNPVAGASVSAALRTSLSIEGAFTRRPTGTDGRFVIRGVPNLPLTLTAYIARSPDAKDRRIRFPATVEVEPGQTDVRIVLDPKLTRGKK